MSQGLHLAQRLSQSLVLSPQMQQSLALLQAPTLELKALVEQELQQNPVLEEVATEDTEQIEKPKSEDSESEDAPTPADPAEPPEDTQFDSTTEKANGEPADDFMAEFERLAQLDQEWRDHFAATNIPMRQTAEEEEKRQFMFDSIVAATSLQETLLEQMRESKLNGEEMAIGELLIGNIDDHGYLKTTLEELAQTTSIPPEKIEKVLHVIQTFDPPGVGARNLQECLLRQLERAGEQDSVEFRIVKDHMEALGKRRIPEIARGLGLDVDEVQEAIGRIARLEPRPGRAFVTDNNQYIMPEVFVQKAGDNFLVSTNNDQIPHLRISNTYKDLMAQSGNSAEVKNYIPRKKSAPENFSSRASTSVSRRF